MPIALLIMEPGTEALLSGVDVQNQFQVIEASTPTQALLDLRHTNADGDIRLPSCFFVFTGNLAAIEFFKQRSPEDARVLIFVTGDPNSVFAAKAAGADEVYLNGRWLEGRWRPSQILG